MYVVSSRGIIHSENQKRESNQWDIDILALIKEAMEVIAKTPRHAKDVISNEGTEDAMEINAKWIFPIPTIVGKVVNTNDLSAASGVEVRLYKGTTEELSPMVNSRWANPLFIVDQMEGTFSFLPLPEIAERAGLQKTINFNLEIRHNEQVLLRKYFEITSVSLANTQSYLTDKICRLDDAYINIEE